MWYLIFGVLLMIAGILMVVWPKGFYGLTESWKSSGSAEPSKRYLVYTRCAGVLLLVIGTVGAVVLLFFV